MITVEDVRSFVKEGHEVTLYTLARNVRFTITRTKAGIQVHPQNGKERYYPIGAKRIASYIQHYYDAPPARRSKTSVFPWNWREKSYMVSLFAALQAGSVYEECKREEMEIEQAPVTVRKALYLARIGQGKFRDDLLETQGDCFVTGVNDPRFLRASHIKAWSISSNEERLDHHNGLLLSPLYDHLFDGYFISFSDTGKLLISQHLPPDVRTSLGVVKSTQGRALSPKGKLYMALHREEFLRRERNEENA